MPTEIDPNMPPALQEAARKELAKVDASIARRNEIFARHPSPGVGGPGSTPQTDATALATAEGARRGDIGQRYGFGSQQYALGVDAPTEVLRARRDPEELIDNAIQRRRELLSQGIDPDRPAIAPDRKRRTEMLHESLALGEAAHRDAATTAHAKAQEYRQQKDIDTSNDLHDFFSGLTAIDKLPEGSPERAAAFYNHVANHPHAASSPLGSGFIKTYAQTHDAAATLKQGAKKDAAYRQQWQQAFKETSLYGRSRGVDVQFNEEGFPSIELTRAHALNTNLTKLGLDPTDLNQKWGTKVEGRMSFIKKGDQWVTLPTTDLEALRNESKLAAKAPTPVAAAVSAAKDASAARTAPKKTFKYNPQTGELE